MNCRRLRGSIHWAATSLVVAVIAFSLLPLLDAQTGQKHTFWMTSEEAFDPSHEGGEPGPNVPPPDRIKKVVLDASYEEVFHAASNAVTQAMWEIDKQDKATSVLLAHRIVDPKRHEFLRLKINELSAKQTEVVLDAKAQAIIIPCKTSIFLGKKGNDTCKWTQETSRQNGKGVWMDANNVAGVSQFVVLLRNNLIATGVQ